MSLLSFPSLLGWAFNSRLGNFFFFLRNLKGQIIVSAASSAAVCCWDVQGHFDSGAFLCELFISPNPYFLPLAESCDFIIMCTRVFVCHSLCLQCWVPVGPSLSELPLWFCDMALNDFFGNILSFMFCVLFPSLRWMRDVLG